MLEVGWRAHHSKAPGLQIENVVKSSGEWEHPWDADRQISSKVERILTKVGQLSSKVDRILTKVGQLLTKGGQLSSRVGRLSSKVGRLLTKVGRLLTKVGRLLTISNGLQVQIAPIQVPKTLLGENERKMWRIISACQPFGQNAELTAPEMPPA